MAIIPTCNECGEQLIFYKNYYKCPKCNKVIEIKDCNLDGMEI